MTYEEAVQKLAPAGQEHLLKYFDEIGEKQKADLLRQVEALDLSLLDWLKKKEAGLDKGELAPLGALTLAEIRENKEQYEKKGLDAVRAHKVGAVLLAGGQGTRLGLDRPKGVLNVGIHKELYLFEQLINNLMEVVKKADTWIPLFIMTSEKNNSDTTGFFEEHDYFGYNRDFVFFFVQDMAPSADKNGKIFLEEKGRISTSPNGNGGWFASMQKAGLQTEIDRLGIEWLNVFAVDNVLQKIADPVFVGATLESGCSCGSKVVAKAEPQERVGVLCLEDGKPSIVEYYEMTDEMIHSKDADGKLLYNYGVILNYLFRIDALKEVMDNNMPIHIVERKVNCLDADGNPSKPETPNGYKFEMLVLDMIHQMPDCLPFEVERNKEFAPIKNRTGVDSLDSARELMQQNGIEI